MKEIKYYGLHACLALWKKRPQDVIRVYLAESNLKILKPLLKWCAAEKKAYHIVPPDDLNRVTDSIHHEGVCILAREQPPLTAADLFFDQPKSCLLYLDGVQNPHNIGSILRTAAHFGIPFILGSQASLPALSPSACRIAKGGAEIVRLIALPKPLETLRQLVKKGYAFIATSSHGGTSLYRFSFPPRSIIALGSESTGIGKELHAFAKERVLIPGSGLIESLNVSVAASLCMGEYCRQHA